jgi:hypothetical protein
MAGQWCPSIFPMTKYRFSKASLACRSTCFDFQRACASIKSIPCFALFLSLLSGSNSNSMLSILRKRPRHLQAAPMRVHALEAERCAALLMHHKRLMMRAKSNGNSKFRLKAWPLLRIRCSGEVPQPTRESATAPLSRLQARHTANIFQE